ncbi:Proline-rich protein 1, partial [Mucuna pruriens]
KIIRLYKYPRISVNWYLIYFEAFLYTPLQKPLERTLPMAFLRSTLATSMLLLALLVIASATDYGYGSATELENPKPKTDYGYGSAPELENPKPKTDYGYGPTPKLENTKPKTDYGYGPTPKLENTKPKTDYGYAPKLENPKPKTDYKSQPITPDYAAPKPEGKDELPLLPTIIAVQGVVLCKSGSNYFPIQGAVARVRCEYEDEFGYETGPISVLSDVTDSKGYFYASLSVAELGSKLKLNECKAYLESSPLETCKVPTDVNYGITGALLSSYRLLDNHTKLYTVGPFFCTSQYAKPLPNVIASATDYGYGPAPELENPKLKTSYGYGPTPKLENPKPKTDYGYGPTPKLENPKPKTDYGYGSAPKLENSKPKTDYGYAPTPKLKNPKPQTDYGYGPAVAPEIENPKPKTDYGYGPTPKLESPKYKTDYKPDYAVPKPKGKDELPLLSTIIAVQGVVLCKSGSNYFPIQGAVARVTCGYEDELGYGTSSISVSSHVTDNKGYFYASLSLAELGSKLKLTECKAYLVSSPLETCKVHTDVNYGITGATLSSYRLLDNNTKLYTVGPFFCTSQYVPNGY